MAACIPSISYSESVLGCCWKPQTTSGHAGEPSASGLDSIRVPSLHVGPNALVRYYYGIEDTDQHVYGHRWHAMRGHQYWQTAGYWYLESELGISKQAKLSRLSLLACNFWHLELACLACLAKIVGLLSLLARLIEFCTEVLVLYIKLRL